MPEVGLEPTRGCPRRILSPIRIVRDSALRSAFMSLFAFVGGMVRVRVRPDCHQSGHQNHLDEARLQGRRRLVAVLGSSDKSFSARAVRD